jgi:hypothetical protein
VTARGRRPLRGSRRGREGSPSADCGLPPALPGRNCYFARTRKFGGTRIIKQSGCEPLSITLYSDGLKSASPRV